MEGAAAKWNAKRTIRGAPKGSVVQLWISEIVQYLGELVLGVIEKEDAIECDAFNVVKGRKQLDGLGQLSRGQGQAKIEIE